MSLLEVEGISVRYGRGPKAITVVHGADLRVERGQTVGLVGESGSGKSTIGRAVLGQVPPTAGVIRFDGQDITRLPGRVRRDLSQRIQVVFQNPYSSLNPQRTIGQSVAETLERRRPRLTGAEVRRQVLETLELVGVPAASADRFPGSFSGGQRQRIAIARALLPRPDLVICDEAVSALDLSIQAQVLNLLIDLQDELGIAYLFITHDLAVVRHFCHRVVVLQSGVVVESGDSRDVCDDPQHPYTRRLLAAAPVADPDAQAAARAARA